MNKICLKLFASIIFLALFCGQVSAQQTGKTSKGIEYRIVYSEKRPKIKLNDVVTFNFMEKTDKDVLLASSYQMKQPMKVKVQPSKGVADLMDIFPLLSEKDSVIVRIPVDSIFKGDQTSYRPPFLRKGYVVFYVKVEKVQTFEEATTEKEKLMANQQALEETAIQKYLTKNQIKATQTASGLLYTLIQPSTKPKPQPGDTVFVNYVGRTLDGKVFDTNISSVAEAAGLKQYGRKYEPLAVVVGQGRVIKGWDEGLLLFNEGASGQLIIKSSLAYGEQSIPPDIKPFSTLVFDIELVEVKRIHKR